MPARRLRGGGPGQDWRRRQQCWLKAIWLGAVLSVLAISVVSMMAGSLWFLLGLAPAAVILGGSAQELEKRDRKLKEERDGTGH